jgi:hypothetical protein
MFGEDPAAGSVRVVLPDLFEPTGEEERARWNVLGGAVRRDSTYRSLGQETE